MKNLMTLLTVLTLSASFTVSQAQTGKISGKVIDGSAKTIESATITLHNAKDSAVAKMGAASKEGIFSFEGIADGKYLVSVTAVGHSKAWTSAFVVSSTSTTVNLPIIELVPLSKDLSAVTVTGRRPLVEQKIDRMVVNVDAAVSNVGATALEVLEKSPGVSVDKDGNISLKGKQGVQIFIDGRPSYLSGAELVNLLKNMNANQLDQIELMTNPPARYDAAGNSGIINIKTKKNKAVGFNGSVTAGYSQGKYWRTNESLNMNYRNGKFNAFMNYSFNRNGSFNELNIHRVYKEADGKTVNAIFDQQAYMPRSSSSNNLKVGVDYFISKKTTVGFVASGFINPEYQKNYNTSYLKDKAGVVDSIVYASGKNDGKWKNGAVNLNLRHQFDSTGRELTADIDYSGYRANSVQSFMNASFDPSWVKKGQTELVSDIPVAIDIYSAKVDYSHPLSKSMKFEAGLKSSYVNTDNSANYYNVLAGNAYVDYEKTNHFKYTENINAAYVNLNKEYKKFGVQAGFRFENTQYKGHQLGNPQKPDSSFSRSYTNVFPTIFVSYKAGKSHQFGASVGRRIDRPDYQDLNPFLFFIDNYTYEAGNPFLQPQYSTNIELSHTFKGYLTSTVNYGRTKNLINEVFGQKDYATVVSRGNIGLRNTAGFSMSAQVPVAKWWNASLYGNYNYSKYTGILNNEELNVSASNVTFNVNNQFKFNKGWSAELSGWYRTKGIEGQIIIKSMGQLNAGVGKQVMKGKGSVRLNIRDIFLTNKASGYINFQRTEASFQNNRDSRVASVSFTYRFGKPIKGPQNSKRNGASDEQNRVKVGGGN